MRFELTSEKVLRNMQLPTHGLDCSVRTRNCLSNVGCEYVWQLVQYSERDLLRLKNFGCKSLYEVKAQLQSLGLGLNALLCLADIEKIKVFQYVPNTDYLRKWLRTTVAKLSNPPFDMLNQREEQILRKRIWSTSKKMSLKQLGRLLGISGTLTRFIEKTILSKIQHYFIEELVDVNYVLLGKFAERCDCIHFIDTDFDLFNLPEQEKIITESLLCLAIDDLVVDWDQSLLVLNEYGPRDFEDLSHYFSEPKGVAPQRFITKEILRGQGKNNRIVGQQKTLSHLKWLGP